MAKGNCAMPTWLAWILFLCGVVLLFGSVLIISEGRPITTNMAVVTGFSLGLGGYGLWERYLEK